MAVFDNAPLEAVHLNRTTRVRGHGGRTGDCGQSCVLTPINNRVATAERISAAVGSAAPADLRLPPSGSMRSGERTLQPLREKGAVIKKSAARACIGELKVTPGGTVPLC